MKKLFFFVLFFAIAISLQAQSFNTPVESVPEDPFEVRPLLIGQTVPAVKVVDIQGQSHNLQDLVAEQPSVIIFYRGGWCPFCSAHLAELAALEEDIYDQGYQILAISPDQPELLRESMEDQELNYTLLSDSPMQVAQAFGVAFRESNETVARLKENGMDIVERSGHDHQMLPVPSVFITDTSGNIHFQYVNPNYRDRISGEVLITAAKANRQEEQSN